MYQNAIFANIIRVEVLYLKVINYNGLFEQLMLNFFDGYILSIAEYQHIARTEIDCGSPTLLRHIKGMLRCCNDFFAVYKNMNKFTCFVNKSLYNSF